jgi:hypothetical protein
VHPAADDLMQGRGALTKPFGQRHTFRHTFQHHFGYILSMTYLREAASRRQANQQVTTDKVRENRLRRVAERQGLRLTKSRRRDPRATDYGVYWLVDLRTNGLESPESGLNLDEVETYLNS